MKNSSIPLSPLTAITPIDGRYFFQTQQLSLYFSEFALLQSRIKVEVLYLQFLSSNKIIRKLIDAEMNTLDSLATNFTLADAQKIKEYESTTRHDVKALEYFLKDKLQKTSLNDITEMIHLGLTSEDVSNLAWSLVISQSLKDLLIPNLKLLIETINTKASEYKNIPMLSRTHGKEAPATTVGKELALFAYRLAEKYNKLQQIKLTGKLTGVVGNYHDLSFALPEYDWLELSKTFISSLGLEPLLFTTQIEPHDKWAELFHLLSEIATIIKSYDVNMWLYISYGYLHVPPKQGQIGSSVMPHKGRNPINFENSEGNAILATTLFDTLARELPNSRLQRHLSDTTLTRNIGAAFAYFLLSLQNTATDTKDIEINEEKIKQDLEDKWGSVTSGLQTKLRLLNVDKPYEQIDKLAKSGKITKERLQEFINGLPISTKDKNQLLSLSPLTYTGKAEQLTDMMIKEVTKLLK